mgnify:CR=1 FL=1
MKRLIIIPIIFICITIKSGVINEKHVILSKDLELIENTIEWVKSESIKRDMRARREIIIKKMCYE